MNGREVLIRERKKANARMDEFYIGNRDLYRLANRRSSDAMNHPDATNRGHEAVPFNVSASMRGGSKENALGYRAMAASGTTQNPALLTRIFRSKLVFQASDGVLVVSLVDGLLLFSSFPSTYVSPRCRCGQFRSVF